jgi:hypothetical protein
VALAARGSRQLDEQAEKIEDQDELAKVRWQASRVEIKSFLSALVLTAIALVLPSFG